MQTSLLFNYLIKNKGLTLISIPIGLIVVTSLIYWLEKDVSTFSNWGEALWFTVVTASTVGYGDISPQTSGGRIFAGLFILFTLASLASILGSVQEGLNEAKNMIEKGFYDCKFEGHVIIFGYSPVSIVAMKEILNSGNNLSIVVSNESELNSVKDILRESGNEAYATYGDISSDSVMKRAGIEKAQSVIVGSNDDTLNMIVTINLRALNEQARIVAYIKRDELRTTMFSSGVTFVTSPAEISGRLLASAAFEPEVALLIDDVSSGDDDGFDLQQFTIQSNSELINQTVSNIRNKLLKFGGPLLIAIGIHTGTDIQLAPNPPLNYEIKQNDILILLGDDSQYKESSKLIGDQGR